MSAEPEGAVGGTLIVNHPFECEDWYETCALCGLSMAAHATARLSVYKAMYGEINALPYRCPYCIDRRINPCPHGREGAIGLDLKPLGGTDDREDR